MSQALDPNNAYFEANRTQIQALAQTEGKEAVLIADGQVVGFFSTVVEAGTEGYTRFGRSQFLACSVEQDDRAPALASIFSAR